MPEWHINFPDVPSSASYKILIQPRQCVRTNCRIHACRVAFGKRFVVQNGNGHRIVGCDVDALKAEQIAKGESPIHEAGLGELLSQGVEQELISATTNVADAVANTDITFVSVGTKVMSAHQT